MKRVIFLLLVLFYLIMNDKIFSYNDSLEVYIIDSYVTPELPHTFILSFITTEEAKTKVIIEDNYESLVSDDFIEDHSAEIDFSSLKFNKQFISYKIISETKDGRIIENEEFELILPYEQFIETKEGDNPITTVLFGLFLYFLPSPNMIITDVDNYFSLTKEIPVITFYSSGYNYPSGTLSLEYTHIYESNIDNYLRLGYKHIIPIDYFEYLSPGITGFTNFNGFNGVSAELSLGLFNIYDVFTVYTRYRYNVKPNNTDLYFHEISLGLYSNFFTIDF